MGSHDWCWAGAVQLPSGRITQLPQSDTLRHLLSRAGVTAQTQAPLASISLVLEGLQGAGPTCQPHWKQNGKTETVFSSEIHR